MTVVQQIVYTANPERWWALAGALGFRAAYPPVPAWGEFAADGSLAVHHADDEHPAGACDLHLIVDDLDAAAAELVEFSSERGVMEGVGDLLTVRAASGLSVTVSEGTTTVAGGEVAVQPIWSQPDISEARKILKALGLREGIAADRGGWVELAGAGGCVGVHTGEPLIGRGFLAEGDLDALAVRLQSAGFEASIVDEAYARTIRVADPDGGDEVWINGIPTDLYGYHREA